ncbi:hypothetical protein DU68_09800 [Methanosarcina mazei]|uniref:DUF4268 domain-containing protein n=1 Tax=Methanosarcina mazei TaxID=2209 RepID=A0A0F8GAT0_METMZ|nr:hypothetical protein DU33_11875 [Methanosarcina mazei]KKG57934.1 hypothetical protein DU64_12785 [Methanosarcina mazei]KKG58263.1 hypothetical protein DU45_12155 [Methanosarcina mazei]KKG97919.1 hypothetical protein DU56_11525 [Methanosarcina mazei]KKG98269.1 hypothetical protein DU68_09800 [Methanosarcina mazei]
MGKLERLQLREVWKNEANDFTPWLQENIDVLNTALDMNLVDVDRETAAGSFNIDLVAKDEDGQMVIIENQLEKSDHDHLGKIITYLTTMSASKAIWIVSDPRPEHVAAIAWLNESSSANFYMVKVEAVRIGNSPAAPLFTLIVGPSEEAKDAGQKKREIAERYILRKRWWTTLLERAAKVTKLHAHIIPKEGSEVYVSAGVPGLSLIYYVTQEECSASLYIDRGKDSEKENKLIFDQLYEYREAIEQAFGEPLNWQQLDGKRACSIYYVRKGGGYRSPEEQWPEIQDSIIQSMVKLEKALSPFLKQLKING